MSSPLKSLASIAAVLAMGATHGQAYPCDYSRPELTAQDRLRAIQKKVNRAEIKKRRKQKHR